MSDNESPAPKTAVVISNDASQQGQTIITPMGKANIIITVVTPIAAVLIRAAKAYLQTLVGLMTAAGFGVTILTPHPGDFFATLRLCAGLSIAAGGMSLLTNVLLLLTTLGDKIPSLKS